MSEQLAKAYRSAPLTKYNWRQRSAIRFISIAATVLIYLFGKLTRFEIEGADHLESVTAAGKQPIYTLWHNRMFFTYFVLRHRGIVQMISQSFDGEYTSRILQRFGFGVIRGSSSTGGKAALAELADIIRQGVPVAFTVDGPRGPRYKVKAGPAVLAMRTGNAVVPFHIAPRKYKAIQSWDRMQIPMPFSKALVLYGEPIFVDANATNQEVDEKIDELQRALDRLVERGREWSGQPD